VAQGSTPVRRPRSPSPSCSPRAHLVGARFWARSRDGFGHDPLDFSSLCLFPRAPARLVSSPASSRARLASCRARSAMIIDARFLALQLSRLARGNTRPPPPPPPVSVLPAFFPATLPRCSGCRDALPPAPLPLPVAGNEGSVIIHRYQARTRARGSYRARFGSGGDDATREQKRGRERQRERRERNGFSLHGAASCMEIIECRSGASRLAQ